MATQVPEQQQQTQGPEGPGMAKTFSENPSMEILRERRIDQMVAKKEAERAQIAQGMQNAEVRGMNAGLQNGIAAGRKEGFDVGHRTGLEAGLIGRYNSGSEQQLGSSLGSLPQIQQQEPEKQSEDKAEGFVEEAPVN